MRTISKTINTIAIIFKIIAGLLFLTGLGEILIDQLLKMLVQGFPTSEMYGDSRFLKIILQNFTLIGVLQTLTAVLLYLTCRGFLHQENWALRGVRFFAWFFLLLNILTGVCFVTQAIPDTLGAPADTFKIFIGCSAGLLCLLFLAMIRRLNSSPLRQAFIDQTLVPHHQTRSNGYHKS